MGTSTNMGTDKGKVNPVISGILNSNEIPHKKSDEEVLFFYPTLKTLFGKGPILDLYARNLSIISKIGRDFKILGNLV